MKNKGFTLLEVLIVVLIIGTLACLSLPMMQRAIMKSQLVELLLRVNDKEKEADYALLEYGWGSAGMSKVGSIVLWSVTSSRFRTNLFQPVVDNHYTYYIFIRIRPSSSNYYALCTRGGLSRWQAALVYRGLCFEL